MGKVTNNFPKKTYFCLINLYAMKITIVSGARPNFMKIAPITRAIKAAQEAGKKISYRLIYTGRQDDTSLDASLFSDLDMKRPDGYLVHLLYRLLLRYLEVGWFRLRPSLEQAG